MDYKVKKAFRDKNTMKRYAVGDSYQADSKERAEQLSEMGYIMPIKKSNKKESE